MSLLHGSCLAAIAVPPSLVVAAAAPAAAQSVGSAAATSAISAAFAATAEPLGLHVLGAPQVESLGPNLSAVTTTAAVPLDQRTTSTFFLRRTLVIAADSNQVVAQTDLRVRYAGVHVTLEYIDHFMPAIDAFAGHTTDLAGKEIRRKAEFDSPGLEAYAAEQAARQRSLLPNARRPLSPSALAAQVGAQNYVETATLVLPDGTAQTYPAGKLDPATILGGTGGAGALTTGCLSNCFNDAGGTIGFVAALCVVAGLAVCVAACAVSEGILCLPCIAGAADVCGVAITVGSLGVCIARCINPSYNPPPPTPRPTATPTPIPCPGDCDGNHTVTMDELLNGVDIALGLSPVSACRAFDRNGDGVVTVNELVLAVDVALNGCSGVNP